MSPDRKKCLVYRRAAVEQRRVCRNRRKPSRIYANGFNQRFFFSGHNIGNRDFTHAHRLCERGFRAFGATVFICVCWIESAPGFDFYHKCHLLEEKLVPFRETFWLLSGVQMCACSHSSDAGQMSSKSCPPCVTATKNKPAHITEATSFSVCWAHHTVANASQLCCCETGCTHAAQMCSWWMSLGFEFWVQSLRD